MSDLISRQDAIDALMSLTVYKSKREVVQAADKHENTWIGGVAECIDEIEDLPSAQPRQTCEYWDSESNFCALYRPHAQPERKNGEWIPEFDGKFTGGAYWFSCSKCKRIVPEVRNGGWNFCPQCGAEMKGEEA